MDKDLALIIVNACNRSVRELGALAPYVRDHCSPEDQAVLRPAIGQSIIDIMKNIVEYVGARRPEAMAEVEQRLDKYGRVS